MSDIVPEEVEIRKIPGRNEPCPCGSRLKYKRCHGDDALRQDVQRVANYYLLLRIMDRLYHSDLIDAVRYDQVTRELHDALIQAIELGSEEEEVVVDSDGLDPKLASGDPSDGLDDPDVVDAEFDPPDNNNEGPVVVPIMAIRNTSPDQVLEQNGLIRCSCGNVYVAGTECMKCKNRKA